MTNSNDLVISHKSYQMGTAPYRWVSVWSHPSKSIQEHNPSAYNKMLSAKPDCCHYQCDHCGMPIEHHMIIKDAEGNLFCVGSSCIEKLGNTELITRARAEVNKRNRLKAQAKRDAKRRADNEAREAKLQAERDSNPFGRTDYEQKLWEKEQAAAVKYQKTLKIIHPVIVSLHHQGGDFCMSLISSLKDSRIPTERAGVIIVEIMAKQHGRKGSKAYKAQLPISQKVYDDMIKGLKGL